MATRLRGVVAGVAWLQAINFGRILSLYFVGAAVPSAFVTMHQIVWPTVLIVVTIATWVIWALWETRRDRELAAHPATQPRDERAT